MMNLPTDARGRKLAIGLTLLVISLLLAMVVVPAYLLHRHYKNARIDAENRIDRYRKVALHKSEHQKALDALRTRDSGRFLLKNKVSNLAGAEMTDLVRPIIEANGARLTSIQPPTVKDEADFRLYSLNIGFNATPTSLQKTLYALETNMPYLFLENVILRATVPRGYKPVPNREPEVSAQIEVQTYGPKDTARAPTRPTGVGGRRS